MMQLPTTVHEAVMVQGADCRGCTLGSKQMCVGPGGGFLSVAGVLLSFAGSKQRMAIGIHVHNDADTVCVAGPVPVLWFTGRFCM